MKWTKLVKASDWKVEKISETDWVIKSPDGTYKNSDGKDYHFKTKEDALEELDYLRAENKFDKSSSLKRKSAKENVDGVSVTVYDHGKSGKAYSVEGLTYDECDKVYTELQNMYDIVDTKNMQQDEMKDKCHGYILCKNTITASKKVKSGYSGGWYVSPDEAEEKLQLWVEVVGAENALNDLAGSLGYDQLSEHLAYIFRMNDFEEGLSNDEE